MTEKQITLSNVSHTMNNMAIMVGMGFANEKEINHSTVILKLKKMSFVLTFSPT